MAEGLLRTRLAAAGIPATVGSAGLLPGGSPATGHAVAVTAARGIDIARHRSRTLTGHLARTTPLIIGMARRHVREAVVTYGALIERTFTLKELVRRGEKVGPRRTTEPVSSWLVRVGAGRVVSDLLGDDELDDVADPIGRPRAEYEATIAELDDLITRLVGLLEGSPAPAR
jgi:protein-tyrosine phosphatase